MQYDDKLKRIRLDPNDKLFVAYFLAGYLVRARQVRKRRSPVDQAIKDRVKAEKVAANGGLTRVAQMERGCFEEIEEGRIKDVGLPVSKTGFVALGVLRRLEHMEVCLSAETWRFTDESSLLLRGLLNKVLGQEPETWVNECMGKLQDLMVQKSGVALDKKRAKQEIVALGVLVFDLFIRKLAESRKLLATAYLIGFDFADGKLDRVLGSPEPSSEPNTPPESYGDIFASIKNSFLGSLNVKTSWK